MRAGCGAMRGTKDLRWLMVWVLCLLLGACAGGGVADTVSQAVDESISAVETARLAAAMDSSGQLTDAAASTAVDDALMELGQARTTVVQLSPGGEQDRDLRDAVLGDMDHCTSAMLAVAEALASEDGRLSLADAQDQLQSAGATLSDLKNRLGGP